MVETPFAAQAAGRLCHSPRGYQEGEKLPTRSVQVVDVREAGQAQAGCKRAQRKQHGAQQRLLPQPEDVGAKAHNLSLYRGGAVQAALRRKRQMVRGRTVPKAVLRTGQMREGKKLRNHAIAVIHSVSPVPGSPKIPTSRWARQEARQCKQAILP